VFTPAAMNADHEMNMLPLVYWLTTCMGQLRRDGQCCGREVQCGWWT